MKPPLDAHASQIRALQFVLEVMCPDRLHWHAHPGIPCTPPDEEHPQGWVCLERIEHEVTTRATRQLRRTLETRRRQAAIIALKRDVQRSRKNARTAAMIHEAAQR